MSVARVNIWGQFAGAVSWDTVSNTAAFEFNPAFLSKKWDIAPLKMPIAEALNGRSVFSFPHLNPLTYKGLPGMLADSLPDTYGNKIIDAWLAQQGRTSESFNPVERLCYTGKRGMGALEFEPVLKVTSDVSEALEVEHLLQLARMVLNQQTQMSGNLKTATSESLQQIISVGTSAGGARAKAIVAFNEKSGDVRSGQIDNLRGYDYWLLKFDGIAPEALGDSAGYCKIEYAYHSMAVACGIEMTACRLLAEKGRSHFMTKRFDRVGNEKLHLQTLCGIAHFDYNEPDSFSYEQAFQVMRQLGLSYQDAQQFFLRMCFNVIANNRDDHTKNVSFIMDTQGVWQLSPAYDITFAFDPTNKWLKAHQLSVNGKRTNIEKKDLVTVAKKMNIKKTEQIIAQVVETVNHWPDFAKDAGVEATQIKAISNTYRLKHFV